MSTANQLAPVLVDTLKRLRLARLLLRRQQQRTRALRECLEVSLALLHERSTQLAALQAEQRRYLARQVTPGPADE